MTNAKLFNVIVEIKMDVVTKVNGINQSDAYQNALSDINDYNLHFNQKMKVLSQDGMIEIKYCDHNDVEVEELVEEDGEFIASVTMNLTLMKDIKAYTYEQAELLAQIYFSDFNLSFGVLEVRNSLEEKMELSVGDWEIQVSDIEEAYEEDYNSTKIEEMFKNFQKTLALVHG
ncbi:hypothetical protein V7079_24495 [Priestia megaterium]|uniref:hypothetical protein n=1 Tax=Priestia megaterium TaxID=1404 RepID=UPI002FFFD46D